MDWFGRQGPMPSFGRFWLKRWISGPKSYRDCQETGQWTSAALFRYLSLLVARGFYMALFCKKNFFKSREQEEFGYKYNTRVHTKKCNHFLRTIQGLHSIFKNDHL